MNNWLMTFYVLYLFLCGFLFLIRWSDFFKIKMSKGSGTHGSRQLDMLFSFLLSVFTSVQCVILPWFQLVSTLFTWFQTVTILLPIPSPQDVYCSVGRQELWDGLWQSGLNPLGSMNPGPHYCQLRSPVLFRTVLCYPGPVVQYQSPPRSQPRTKRDQSSSPSLDQHSQTQVPFCAYCIV